MNRGKILIAQLGEVMQIAFIPADFDAALRFWTETMGVGPFFLIDRVKMTDAKYRGAAADFNFSVAIAYWGDLQVELVRQHDDAPSIYKEWRDAGREGLHHVCLVTPDLQHARELCAALGLNVVQEGRITGGEAIYVETGGGPGTLVEIIQLSAPVLAGFAAMREAARCWDGTAPLRRLGG
jgi:catechol 2,3-dioxygenase-like lactoylglutathione lyase family enzyme